LIRTSELFKNKLGGQILFDIFLTIPLNKDNQTLYSFRHFPRHTNRMDILRWFERQFGIDLIQYLIDNLTYTGEN